MLKDSWLTDVMGAAGIDTSVYRAHSVRGAASSAAARAGMSTADILQCADWAAVSTFRRFYLRDLPDNNAVCSTLPGGRSTIAATYDSDLDVEDFLRRLHCTNTQ